MIEKPMDILNSFPVRKSAKQKKAFRAEIASYVEALGYRCTIEKGSLGAKNIIIGNPESASHLITAHYDTCAGMPFPNLIMPCNFWLFLLSQLAVTVLLFIPGVIVGLLVGLLSNELRYGELAFYITLLLTLFLMMYGPANRSNANDNTSGVITLLEIAKSFPEAYREQVCFVLFDLEETGLVGSSSYRSKHKKETQNQLVWNLDCVGDGDTLMFFPSKKVKKDQDKLSLLQRCCTDLATKTVSMREKGFSIYPSDQANFPYGVGIAALKSGKWGLYLDKIHTKHDTTLDETNVNILRAAIISAITCDGVQ